MRITLILAFIVMMPSLILASFWIPLKITQKGEVIKKAGDVYFVEPELEPK